MKNIVFICFCLFFSIKNNVHAQATQPPQEEQNYVPDSITAIKIAEAVWLPKYGKRIYKKKPFTATLQNDTIWVVRGTLHHKKGGAPFAEIQKKDGKIINVYYTK